MEAFLHSVGFAASMVFDPSAGRGANETLVGLLIVGAFVLSLFFKHDEGLETVLVAFTSAVLAFYFGYKVREYAPPPE